MKILFVTTYYHAPQSYGGLSMTLDQLCRKHMKRGHKVTVLAGMKHGGLFAWKSLTKMKINGIISGHKITRDTGLGYPVWRTWFPWEEIEYVASKEKPDLIIAMGGKVVLTVLAARKTGIPVLAQVHDVEFHFHGGDFKELGNVPCVANSKFTAETYRRAFGVKPTVVYPFIAPEKYRTETTRENVTFINPLPWKGRNLALEIARLCPEIPFSFVGNPLLPEEKAADVMPAFAALPNVTLVPDQDDMRKVYGKCKILLVPSLWEEAYGRVATEAQISGIPVIASARGGLPEAVGPGGILLDPEGPADEWVKAIRKLWHDDKYYAETAAAAITHAQRPEMNLTNQINAHEQILIAVCHLKKS